LQLGLEDAPLILRPDATGDGANDEVHSGPGQEVREMRGSRLNDPYRARHWITWSARANMEGRTVRPRALAVLRLMASSYFVGCSTGRSAGLAPFRILSIYVADRLYKSE